MEQGFNKVCLRYSIPAVIIATALGLFFSGIFNHSSTTSFWPDFLTIYLLASVAVATAVFTLRTYKHGIKTATDISEISVASLTAAGFALPIAIVGILLVGISNIGYEGAERWMPEIEEPEEELQRIITELELSQETYNRSLELLETIKDYGLLKGRPLSEMIPAIVYITAREKSEPRTLGDIAEVARCSKKELGRAYRYIGRNMGISIRPPSPLDYLPRFADRMGLSYDVEERARKMIKDAEERSITSGKSPGGMAVSALYLASYIEGEDRTMTDMSNTLDITSATIRNRSKDLIDALGIEDYPDHLGE